MADGGLQRVVAVDWSGDQGPGQRKKIWAGVWTAAGSCEAPENPKVIPSSGFHQLSFSPEEVQGKDMVCLTSSDGVLRTSARLAQ